MKARIASILLAAFCSLTPALAQDAVPPAADPARVALAEQILQASNAAANIMNIIEAMGPVMERQLKLRAPRLTDDQVKEMVAMVRDDMRANLPQALHLQAEVYARHFTAEDLNGLIAFYNSPLGKKLNTELPNVMKETLPIGQVWAMASAQHAMERAVEKMRAQGVKI